MWINIQKDFLCGLPKGMPHSTDFDKVAVRRTFRYGRSVTDSRQPII